MRSLFLAVVILTVTTPARSQNWTGSWSASQQIPEPANALPAGFTSDFTLRQIVHLSASGRALRVHISNAFGTTPLHIASAHIARPLSTSSPKIDPASDKPLSFSGQADVIIPPAAEYLSDPIDYPAAALSDLAITLYIDKPPAQQTGHPGSRATSYLAHGDLVSAPDLSGAKLIEHWYFVSAVDVQSTPATGSIVALGDSITDGHGTTTNGNDRWTDVLAQRLQAAHRPLGVLNQGIGGNHLLTDGLGPSALARFDRDVLAQTAVRYVIVLEGINDLGGLAREHPASAAEHAALVQRIIAAYEQIVARAHAHGVKVFGATVTPDGGSDYYHPDAASEADRTTLNQWIRTPGHFDAVIDFDRAARDPAHPERLLPAYDGGDHLHPSPAGYRAMAASIPLTLFQP
jgi:lysophospholipase L1-like esterase